MQTIVTTTRTTTTTPAHRARIVLATVAGALAGWAVAVPLLGVDLTVTMGTGQPPMTIGPGAVIATTLVMSLAGWASLAVLERLSTKARATWTSIAVAVLLISFVPLLAVDASGAAKAPLALLHVVVAAVLVAGLTGHRPPLPARIAAMSAFTSAERAYLSQSRLARLATVGSDSMPHVTPVAARGIEIGGPAEAISDPRPLIRVHPARVVSWGMDTPPEQARLSH